MSCPLDDYHFYGAMLAEQLQAAGRHGGLPLGARAPVPRRGRGLPRRLPRPARGGVTRRLVAVSGDSCGGLLGLGALIAARDEGLPSGGLLRLDLRLVRPLRCFAGSRARPSIPSSRPSGCATGAGSTPRGAWRSTTRGSRRPTRTCRACRRSTSQWGARHAARGGRGAGAVSTARRGRRHPGVVARNGARLAGPGQRRGARGAGVVRAGTALPRRRVDGTDGTGAAGATG